MAHITEDRVLETSTSTGTGALTLAGAVTGYRTFASGLTVGDTVWYSVWGVNVSGDPTGEWESGLGTYSGTNTLTRTTVLESSNAGSVVTLSAGTKYVAITLTAQRTAQFDHVGALPLLAASSVPAAPSSGGVVYARESVPQFVGVAARGPGLIESPMQEAIAFRRIVKYQGGGNALVAIGGGALTASATGAGNSPLGASDLRTGMARTQFTTAATAGSVVSVYANANTLAAHVYRGTTTGLGGFRVVMRFNFSGLRLFAGLRDVLTAPTNINPMTATTPGGVGLAVNRGTNNNICMVHNLSGTAPTVVDLGSSMTVSPFDGSWIHELVLFCRPCAASTAQPIGYRVRRYLSDNTPLAEVTGTISTNLPGGLTYLHPTIHHNNDTTAGAVNFQLAHITIETDF